VDAYFKFTTLGTAGVLSLKPIRREKWRRSIGPS
jgi:hypothetical protein